MGLLESIWRLVDKKKHFERFINIEAINRGLKNEAYKMRVPGICEQIALFANPFPHSQRVAIR